MHYSKDSDKKPFMSRTISSSIETENLIIRDAVEKDIPALKSICCSWTDKQLLEGEWFEESYIEKCISEGDLPPIANASRALYQLKAICSKKDSSIVGFLDVYHGYPNPSTVWISIFVVNAQVQQHGVGREAVAAIAAAAKEKGYASLGIGVHLKNWKGLRFLTRNGFDRITDIRGDKDYGSSSFSVIYLEKPL